ncbi:MAG TPA: hypothetical protein VHB47_04370, partial [Thermoanaerobaculia bacterium]|nr:hypothetical protein [Thermoanaerobaculia bacterium]
MIAMIADAQRRTIPAWAARAARAVLAAPAAIATSATIARSATIASIAGMATTVAAMAAMAAMAAQPAMASAAAATPAAAPEDVLPTPANIVARHVPPIPRAAVEALQPYENMRSAAFADWHPRERRLLVLTRFAQAVQLHEVAMPLGDRTQLTFYDEPVTTGAYRPSDPSQIVVSVNAGGAEN